MFENFQILFFMTMSQSCHFQYPEVFTATKIAPLPMVSAQLSSVTLTLHMVHVSATNCDALNLAAFMPIKTSTTWVSLMYCHILLPVCNTALPSCATASVS